MGSFVHSTSPMLFSDKTIKGVDLSYTLITSEEVHYIIQGLNESWTQSGGEYMYYKLCLSSSCNSRAVAGATSQSGV